MLSIVTPVLNGSIYIEQTIQSILKLEIEYEHIIVDGGSTDGTLDIVEKYDHIKLIHQTDGSGMYGAIDIGFGLSSGDYITWINSDDRILSENYKVLYESAKKQSASLAYSDAAYHFIDQHRYENVPALPFPKYFLRNGIMPFVQPSCIFSRDLYYDIGGLNYPVFKIIGDRDLFQRFSLVKDIKIVYIPKKTVIFLRHSDSLLYQNLDKVKQERLYTIRTNDTIYNRLLFYVLRKIIRIYKRAAL